MNFNFASPNFAYLLFLLPVIALFKIWADLEAKKSLEGFASSSRLRATLLEGASVVRANLHFGLIVLGIGFFIIALTRPQLGKDEKDIEQTGRNILIALDTSKSMLAEDLAPSRMERARLAAQDLLAKLSGDRVGIIAFAGRAFLQAPLTTDQEALVETVQTLDHTTIPRGGSSLASAIELAIDTAKKAQGTRHGLVIFTDGQETDEAALEAARTAAEMNLIILPVGVGTTEGTLIPDPNPLNDGGYIRDEDGNIVKTKLESQLLREIARITGGEYVELASQPLTQTLVDRVMANLDRHDDKSRHLSKPIERYQWPLLAGILCIMLSQLVRPSHRRPVRTAALPVDPRATVHQPRPLSPLTPPALPTAVMVGLLLAAGLAIAPTSAHAVVARPVKEAREHYNAERYKEAKEAYTRMLQSKKLPAPAEELYYGLGASELKLKEYDTAVKSFSDALKSHNPGVQKPALRGLATSLYEQGEVLIKSDLEATIKAWTDSRDHFDTAMGLEKKKDSDAYRELSENRALVQKRLDEVKEMLAEQQARQKAQQEKRKQQKKQKQQQQGQGGEGEPDEEQEGEGEQQSPENEDGGDKEKKQKQTDALQEGQQEIMEGELRAGEAGKDAKPGQGQPDADHMRNDRTGYTPFEAGSMLRMYSDEQKSTQYLMRRERALGGKDY